MKCKGDDNGAVIFKEGRDYPNRHGFMAKVCLATVRINGRCQKCTQLIVGRDLSYNQAREYVQDELGLTDFVKVGRNKRDLNAKKPYEVRTNYAGVLDIGKRLRTKRASDHTRFLENAGPGISKRKKECRTVRRC